MLGTLFSSAPLLDELSILKCIVIEHFNSEAPALKALQFIFIPEFKSVSFKNCPNLARVALESLTPLFEVDNPEWGKTTNLIELFASLPKIEKLLLDNFVLEQISFILCLLESSTDLEELRIWAIEKAGIAMQPVSNFLKESKWTDMKLNTLRTVELALYECSRAELFFIEFLLGRSPILGKMFIKLSRVDANEGCRTSEEVMRFSRASEKAEVIF
ncbi:F-box/FBD/LRR-repeat protein At1g13570-like [Cornus florida]|uniref:F-box/FBD/LRR-repeat protein At1g13570-like n=1 Tax=Cornus florida TaxID=4283 RepID=UPI0028A2D798|nr:F-box/FBD/LRR-repeat protein At1g13570-like [Cornus florida]